MLNFQIIQRRRILSSLGLNADRFSEIQQTNAGGNVELFNFRKRKALLPVKILGRKRTSIEGERISK